MSSSSAHPAGPEIGFKRGAVVDGEVKGFGNSDSMR
jgi:hypothetical protein